MEVCPWPLNCTDGGLWKALPRRLSLQSGWGQPGGPAASCRRPVTSQPSSREKGMSVVLAEALGGWMCVFPRGRDSYTGNALTANETTGPLNLLLRLRSQRLKQTACQCVCVRTTQESLPPRRTEKRGQERRPGPCALHEPHSSPSFHLVQHPRFVTSRFTSL